LKILRPRPLQRGDLLGVCAPSGPVDSDRLRAGVEALLALGFRVQVGEGILSETHLTAGSIARRVEELHTLFRDDAVAAVFCARGGEGAGWLLRHLDRELIRSHPKPLLGYSDVTFLHLLLDRLGIVSFHGPMVAVDFPLGDYEPTSFWGALGGEGRYTTDLATLRPGRGEGRLRGGCLSILASAVGTPWSLAPEDEGTLLFLEDVDEPPYQIDRMLFQLREGGAFASVVGIVFGEMKGCSPRREAAFTLDDVLLDALDGLDIPVARGLPSGHCLGPSVTLPLGVRARLTCGTRAAFEILEDAVL
jgi:muramoyltetrapeptide carboxypeptidase